MSIITPDKIDIATLPSLLWKERCNAPETPAVYLFLHEQEVIYVGVTMRNLMRRLAYHNLKNHLETLEGNVCVAWINTIPVYMLESLEIKLVYYLNPKLNIKKAASPISWKMPDGFSQKQSKIMKRRWAERKAIALLTP